MTSKRGRTKTCLFVHCSFIFFFEHKTTLLNSLVACLSKLVFLLRPMSTSQPAPVRHHRIDSARCCGVVCKLLSRLGHCCDACECYLSHIIRLLGFGRPSSCPIRELARIVSADVAVNGRL